MKTFHVFQINLNNPAVFLGSVFKVEAKTIRAARTQAAKRLNGRVDGDTIIGPDTNRYEVFKAAE